MRGWTAWLVVVVALVLLLVLRCPIWIEFNSVFFTFSFSSYNQFIMWCGQQSSLKSVCLLVSNYTVLFCFIFSLIEYRRIVLHSQMDELYWGDGGYGAIATTILYHFLLSMGIQCCLDAVHWVKISFTQLFNDFEAQKHLWILYSVPWDTVAHDLASFNWCLMMIVVELWF